MASERVAGFNVIPIQSLDERDALIRAAIACRRPMTAVYEGRQRLLCPYMLGRNKEGHLRLLGYQYGGESGSGLQLKDGRGDWRCFSVEKMGSIRLNSVVISFPTFCNPSLPAAQGGCICRWEDEFWQGW